jgi:benzoyl-CoA reductase/2-hydroxyglutaryl-CoA dehydratase subunit BcrC/BadD/HgdB
MVHLAPMVLLRGTQAAVDYYRLLLAELEDRVSAGVGAVSNEAYRFYWDGPPVWCASRTLSGIFGARGIAVVASTYADLVALADLDEDDPVQSLARAYTAICENRSESFKTSYLASKFMEYGVDAAVFHDCRTSPDTSHARYGMGQRLERMTSVPAFVLEADSHDPRLFSSERLDRHLAEFTEQHRERFADRLVAY